MVEWIGAVQGVRAASGLVQSLLTLKTDAAVQSKVVELNGVLLGLQGELGMAQAEHAALSGRVRDLETQITEYEHWENEKQRYQLHKFPTGVLAYSVKPEFQGSEPAHYICAACYEDGIKSLLQPRWEVNLECGRCNSSLLIKDSMPVHDRANTDFNPYQ